MGTYHKPPLGTALPFLACLCTGACLGILWAMRMEEERKRRLRKTFFELRELPFRVFI